MLAHRAALFGIQWRVGGLVQLTHLVQLTENTFNLENRETRFPHVSTGYWCLLEFSKELDDPAGSCAQKQTSSRAHRYVMKVECWHNGMTRARNVRQERHVLFWSGLAGTPHLEKEKKSDALQGSMSQRVTVTGNQTIANHTCYKHLDHSRKGNCLFCYTKSAIRA